MWVVADDDDDDDGKEEHTQLSSARIADVTKRKREAHTKIMKSLRFANGGVAQVRKHCRLPLIYCSFNALLAAHG